MCKVAGTQALADWESWAGFRADRADLENCFAVRARLQEQCANAGNLSPCHQH